MSWSGDVFNRLYSWVADKNNGVKIRADRMDAEFDNFKGGLEACLLRSGDNGATGNIPFNGSRITGLGDGVDEQDAATVLQLAQATPGYNFIDNGGFEMVLDPVRTVATASAAGSHICDRWFGGRGGVAGATISAGDMGSTVLGFPYAARLWRDNANADLTPLYIGQSLGSENSRLAQYLMLASGSYGLVASAYFKKGANFSGANATLQIRRLKGASGNPVTAGSIVATVDLAAASINTAGVGVDWVRVELPYTDTSSNQDDSLYAVVVTYTPVGTAGADDTLYVTGVKLELNQTGIAGAYAIPPMDEARRRCARFYQVFGGEQYAIRKTGYTSAGAEDWENYFFPRMDIEPTIAKAGTWTVGNCAQPTAFATKTSFSLYTTITATAAFGYYTNDSTHKITLDSEMV